MPELTKNEEILLIAVLHLGKNAYGVHIRRAIHETTHRRWNYGTLYRMLDQLVRKGVLERMEGIPISEKGGRRKNYYSLTGEGVKVLEEAAELHMALWGAKTTAALKEIK